MSKIPRVTDPDSWPAGMQALAFATLCLFWYCGLLAAISALGGAL